jgi:hypothetical protein
MVLVFRVGEGKLPELLAVFLGAGREDRELTARVPEIGSKFWDDNSMAVEGRLGVDSDKEPIVGLASALLEPNIWAMDRRQDCRRDGFFTASFSILLVGSSSSSPGVILTVWLSTLKIVCRVSLLGSFRSVDRLDLGRDLELRPRVLFGTLCSTTETSSVFFDDPFLREPFRKREILLPPRVMSGVIAGSWSLSSPLVRMLGVVAVLDTRGSKLRVDFSDERRIRLLIANGENGLLVGLDGLVGQVEASSSVNDRGTSRWMGNRLRACEGTKDEVRVEFESDGELIPETSVSSLSVAMVLFSVTPDLKLGNDRRETLEL